jgi:hypothetical protein
VDATYSQSLIYACLPLLLSSTRVHRCAPSRACMEYPAQSGAALQHVGSEQGQVGGDDPPFTVALITGVGFAGGHGGRDSPMLPPHPTQVHKTLRPTQIRRSTPATPSVKGAISYMRRGKRSRTRSCCARPSTSPIGLPARACRRMRALPSNTTCWQRRPRSAPPSLSWSVRATWFHGVVTSWSCGRSSRRDCALVTEVGPRSPAACARAGVTVRDLAAGDSGIRGRHTDVFEPLACRSQSIHSPTFIRPPPTSN